MSNAPSCHSCGGSVLEGGLFPTHRPGCMLKADANDCREPDDLKHSCRFLNKCSPERRRTAVAIGARGANCFAFEGHLERAKRQEEGRR